MFGVTDARIGGVVVSRATYDKRKASGPLRQVRATGHGNRLSGMRTGEIRESACGRATLVTVFARHGKLRNGLGMARLPGA